MLFRCPPQFMLVFLLCGVASSMAQSREHGLEDAEVLYRQSGPQAALGRFEVLVADFEAAGDQQRLGKALHYMGEIRWRLGNYRQAEETLERALQTQRAADDRLQEGKTLNVLGLLAWDLGEFGKAQEYFSAGSEIAAAEGDSRLAGAILNNLGLVYDEIGRYDDSLESYRRALDLYKGEDFKRGEGDTLGNIGGVYLLLGRYRQALEQYEQALTTSEQLDSVISMSQDHGNIALSKLGLGQVDEAATHLDVAIGMAEKAGMQQDRAYWLRERGKVMQLRGQYGKALEDLRAALEIYRRIESRTEMVEALHDLANLHLALGDSGSAERDYRKGMDLAREIGLSQGVTQSLLALGDLEVDRGEFDSASALYEQAGTRAGEAGEMALLSAALLRQTSVLSLMKQGAGAVRAATRALAISREIGAAGLEAEAFYALAEQSRLAQHFDQALQSYDRVLALLATSADADLEWRAWYGKGRVLEGKGEIEPAIEAMVSAVGVIEGVRETIRQERFRAGYIQDKYQVYVDLVGLQIHAGRKAEAFGTAERLRSQSYLDLLGNGPLPQRSDGDVSQEFALGERIRVLRQALREENRQPGPEQRQAAIRIYSRELHDAEREYQALLDERSHPNRAGREKQIPVYTNIVRRLGLGEGLVEYVVGQDRVMYFLISGGEIDAGTIAMRREDLDNKVELLRSLIRHRDDDRWLKPAASLSRQLLAPLRAKGVLENLDHLYIVPHGSLNYLPFALLPVLPESGQRIIEKLSLAYLPTAATLFDGRRARHHVASMLAMAPARAGLRHAVDEARAVDEMFTPDSTALVGRAATESAFKSSAGGYRLLHLATHGYFNKLNPMLSGLELEEDDSNDGRLDVYEILGLELDADLVTLSACQTGMGSGYFAEIPAGDDFVGLTRAFLYAGSASVLATLWEVDDASTMGLMKAFYSDLRQVSANDGKAAALAKAQRSLLSSINYSHPYYWAPFVLVGDTTVRRRPG